MLLAKTKQCEEVNDELRLSNEKQLFATFLKKEYVGFLSSLITTFNLLGGIVVC